MTTATLFPDLAPTREPSVAASFHDLTFKPDRYTVHGTTFQAARRLISRGHYTQSLTKGRLCYGLYRDTKLVGVAVYGQPSGRNVAASIWTGGDEQNTLELLRLYLLDGTGPNAESWFLARTRRLLPRDVRMLVAYSAEAAGHHGGCYQADNWLYVGRSLSGQNYYYTDTDGQYVNKRIPWQYGPRNGTKHTEAEAADLLGLTRHEEPPKHAYIYPLDRQARNAVIRTVLPYPKPDQECAPRSHGGPSR